MNIFAQKKGLTLVETLAAIAILGIILVPLIGVVTNVFTNIITMGEKTSAIAKAQAVIDYIYSEKTYDPTILTSVFDIKNKVDDLEQSTYDPHKPIYYSVNECIINGELFEKVTILVFYHNGNRYITISALIT
jgi:prepilin-type N-terminal cleavage/methylation domain-containing protein